jgi:hypothetical protein
MSMRTCAVRLHPAAISGFTASVLSEPRNECFQVWTLSQTRNFGESFLLRLDTSKAKLTILPLFRS